MLKCYHIYVLLQFKSKEMKKYICIAVIFLTMMGEIFGQLPSEIKKRYSNSFDVYTDIILAKPENFTPKAMNMGYSFSVSYLIPVAKSNFSFSVGGGLSFHNIYSNAVPKDAIPEDLQKESWGDDFYFMTLDSIGGASYTKNKMAFINFDIPVEILYYADNGLRFTAGVKLCFNIGSNTKYSGIDYLYGTEETCKYKKYDLKNISSFGITPIVRFGWKWFNLYASYSLIPIYDATGGNCIRPISVGMSFMMSR